MGSAATGAHRFRKDSTVSIEMNPSVVIFTIRKGVPAAVLPKMAKRLGVPKSTIYESLSIPASTAYRLIVGKKKLSPEHSERVLGVQILEELVQRIVEESGNSKGFDASAWLGTWINEANPALGGKQPASYLDTMTGQALVRQLLLRSQSGAYA